MSRIQKPSPFVLSSTVFGTMILNFLDSHSNGQGHYGVGHQLLNSGDFDPDESDFALTMLEGRRKNFGPGVVALDCGANIGTHTVKWASAMNTWGEVLAFEAQERIFYALAGNIAINNCFNARAFHAALSTMPGRLRIPVPDYFRQSSFGSLELKPSKDNEFIGQEIDYSDERMAMVPMMSIDDLSLPRVDFIKIDVEGMETEVLIGARQTLIRHRPQMMIEWIKTGVDRIASYLQPLGYRLGQQGINLIAVHESDPSLTEQKG